MINDIHILMCPSCQTRFGIQIPEEYKNDKKAIEYHREKLDWKLKNHIKNECKITIYETTKQ